MFWSGLLVVAAGGIGALAWMGPVAEIREQASPVAPLIQKPEPGHEAAGTPPATPALSRDIAARQNGGVIAPPDPALLEPAPDIASGMLPRIAADGRAPMTVYAAGFDEHDQRPRIALLVAGIGMSAAESRLAIANLPSAVSLAVSPYAAELDELLGAARAGGHETLVSLPMEPQGYPLNDPGHHAMLTGASLAANAQRLDWALTRFGGYVGATGALGALRGERFAAASDQMEPILEVMAQRGLLYVDPRPNARRQTWRAAGKLPYRGVDLVVDDPAGRENVESALARLEVIALNRGAAIGLIGRPAPLTLDRIGVWLLGLEARGIALAPVSVVVQMPQAPDISRQTHLSSRGPP